VDVVIDQEVAVLQILPLRNTIGGNEQVNFPFAWGNVLWRSLEKGEKCVSNSFISFRSIPGKFVLFVPLPLIKAAYNPYSFNIHSDNSL
jgi:hypothetical protein